MGQERQMLEKIFIWFMKFYYFPIFTNIDCLYVGSKINAVPHVNLHKESPRRSGHGSGCPS